MKTYQSSSTVYPLEWDKESCPSLVFHNTDVEEIPAHDDEPVMYQYTVTEYTLSEYITFISDKNTADIEYVAMMTDVPL